MSEREETPNNPVDCGSRCMTPERYRSVFEHSLAGVYCTTLDGVILDCNDSLASMLGYSSRAEVLALRAGDLYVGDADRESFIRELRRAGVLTNSEICLQRKDGTPIHLLENVVLLPDETGERRIIQGTMIDITARKQAEEALRESGERYRALADELRRVMRRLERIREEERGRIARELHDEFGQALTVLNMDLHWLKGRAWRNAEETRSRIASMCELVNSTLQSVRAICADLRPAVLDDLGLVPAIEWQTREFESRTGIRCEVSLPRSPVKMSSDQATAVFRILQESLTNVARHAGAQTVKVTLAVESGVLSLTVVDDGVGVTVEQAAGLHSVGLVGMRERAIRWGGDLTISGAPRAGTTVAVKMPIGEKSAESG